MLDPKYENKVVKDPIHTLGTELRIDPEYAKKIIKDLYELLNLPINWEKIRDVTLDYHNISEKDLKTLLDRMALCLLIFRMDYSLYVRREVPQDYFNKVLNIISHNFNEVLKRVCDVK